MGTWTYSIADTTAMREIDDDGWRLFIHRYDCLPLYPGSKTPPPLPIQMDPAEIAIIEAHRKRSNPNRILKGERYVRSFIVSGGIGAPWCVNKAIYEIAMKYEIFPPINRIRPVNSGIYADRKALVSD